MQEYSSPFKPWYKKRWFRVVVTLFILMLGMSWLGSHILVKPDDTLLDTMEYAVKTPAAYQVTSTVANGSLVVAGNGFSWSGTIGGIDADAILMDQTLYVKSPAPEKIYRMLTGDDGQTGTAIQSIADELRGQWIKSDLQKGQLGAQLSHTLRCVDDQRNALQHSDSARKEWRNALGATSFWVIRKSTTDADSATYQLLMDTHARASFFSNVGQTAYYQSLSSCVGSVDMSGVAIGKWLNATVTFSKQTNAIQSTVIDLGNGGMMTITPNYQTAGSVAPPAGALSLDQLLLKYLKSILHIK